MAETESSIKAYEWFAEECKRAYGDIIPAPVSNKRFLVVKQPVGVCGRLHLYTFPFLKFLKHLFLVRVHNTSKNNQLEKSLKRFSLKFRFSSKKSGISHRL
jgi:hypothetical protein